MAHISLEELLDIEEDAAIDYEITFAALLATTLLTIGFLRGSALRRKNQ
jgi:hypothetical protein